MSLKNEVEQLLNSYSLKKKGKLRGELKTETCPSKMNNQKKLVSLEHLLEKHEEDKEKKEEQK